MSSELKKDLKEKSVGYIVGAFGLVAGLAWNEAIKGLIELLFPLEKDGLLAKFAYAIIMTLVLVIVANYLVNKFSSKKD